MSTKLKKCLSVFLVVVTLLTSAPFYNTDLFDLFSVEAEAVSLSDYNATAAAQWAKEHCNDIDSVILGKGYWTDGGDCANFVSQCLYMGGIDMSKDWNTNGYFCHWYEYNSSFNGSFIRAQQLYNYLTNGLGATSIRAPKASQMSVGDVIIYSADGAGRMTHCAIVVKADSTGVEIAYHSVLSNGEYKREITPSWQLQFSNSRTYLIKMNGKLCDENNPYAQKFDVYTTGSGGQKLYANSSRTGSVLTTYLANEYTHVFRTETVNGVTVGYTFRYGKWGWVQLSKLNYQRSVSSANTSHTFGPWITVDKGTCTTNGIDQRTCTRCGKVENRTIVGSHVTDPKATCTQPGTCKLCGVVTEGALGHNMVTNRTYTLAEVNSGAYGITLKKAPTCTENGTGTIKCSRCIYTETVAISATGHNWQFSITNPSCVQPGAAVYKCSNCASEKSGYENPNSTISDWTDKVISGLTPISTKTQYRYKTKSTTTSYETSLSGWTQNGGNWVHQSTNSFNYASFPSGFDTGNSIYTSFHKSCDVSAYTNATNKREVSTAWAGYVYWHWMYDTSYANGTSSRAIYNKKGTGQNGYYYQYFGAFTSSNGNYSHDNYYCNSLNITNYIVPERTSWNDCQGATRWFRFDYYTCTYKDYAMLYNYYKWSDWSGWQDAAVSATSDRQVETRTVYKYDLAAMGHNFNVEDSNNYKAPTCTEPGYIGTKCSRCGVMSDKTKTIPALGHNMGSWYNYGSYTSGSTTITVYRRDCQRTGCTYYELKQNEKTYVPGNIVAATCSTDGYTEYKNTSNASDIFKFDFVTALGHKADENWVVTKAATCFSEGEEQCKCVRHDNGKTCNKTFSRPIELIPHTPEKVDAVPENCLEDGIIEHYKCKICDKLFADQKCNTQLSEEDIIVKHEGHNEGIWKEIQALKHDETGKQAGMYELHCTREHIDENGNKYICDALLDEYTVNPPECVFELAERVDPECNALGYEIHRCPLCKDEYTIWIDMLPHPWGETETIYLSPKDPEICYSKQTTCTHCGIINEDTYEEFTHNLETVTLEGECVSGSKEVCKICDYEVPAKDPAGHTWSQWEVTIAPTCDTEGEEQRHCTVCSKTDPNTLSATGHDYVETEKVGATCTESGYIVMICQNDNSHTYKKITDDPLGHDLCDWYTVKEATCAEKGLERCDCQREYCDFSATRDTAVKPDAHDWDDGVIAPDSTCKDHGTKTYICQNDASHTYTEEVALDENNHAGDTYIKDAKEPDCTNDGYTGDTYCSDCDAKLEDGKVIPPTGHNWDDGIIDPDSTCKDHGTKTFTCQNDTSHTKTESVPLDKNNHVGKTYIKDEKDANCTENGYTGDTYCSDCDAKLKDGENIRPTGHNYIGVTTAPTCEEQGYTTYTCSKCADSYVDDYVNAHDHDYHFIAEKSKSPDYGIAGYDYYECSYDASHNYTVVTDPLVKTTYTATFIVKAPFFDEDKTVGTVTFEQGDKYVDEPSVESYKNYTFAWDEYELKYEDIVIYGRYTEIETDDISDLETKKTAEYNNGVATITLEAKSDTKNIKVLSENTKPVDVILVLDQSGSMAETLGDTDTTKKDALINCANRFVNELYENAVATGADHRVALVGFAYSDYSTGNYVNTGILATTQGNSYNYTKLTDSAYKTALIPVVSDNGINKYITNGINNVAADGATAADLGLAIANDIYAVTKNDGTRERIVIFITDGTPTSWGQTTSLVEETSAAAITQANRLKNQQGAKIYSIGVHANAKPEEKFTTVDSGVTTNNRGEFKSFDFNRFLHAVSSNYPDSGSMKISDLGNGSKDSGFYMGVNDTSNLSNIFSKILYSAVYEINTFDKVTLVDTISKEFTLTLEQEAEMRENLTATLGIRNEDISVIRNADGTTTVKFANVRATKVYNNDGSSYYSASVSFKVSADADSLAGGNIATNTDDAYVEMGNENIGSFTVPTVNIEQNRNIIVFTINGIVYRIDEVNLGDNVIAPESELAKWNIAQNTLVTENCAYFEASEISKAQYTVTWISEGKQETQTYTFGSTIKAPEAGKKAKFDFIKWSPDVPATMPAYNMTFTAVYTPEHTHKFKKSHTYGNCEDGITTVYVCSCGETNEETTEPTTHTCEAVVAKTNSGTLIERVSCTVCGKYVEQNLTYKVSYSQNKKTVVLDLSLYENEILVQPDGTLKIMFYLGNDANKKYTVSRIDENGKTTKYTPEKKNGYLIFDADHFSIYVITEIESENGESSENIGYKEALCVLNGHSYASEIKKPTCTLNGYTTYTCSDCGDTYTADETVATGHADENKDGKCDSCDSSTTDNCKCTCHKKGFMSFIWKIIRFLYKLFRINKTCNCGVIHW